MTSFANTFGSSGEEQNYASNIGMNSTRNTEDDQGPSNFSSIDLGQQSSVFKQQHSPYVSLNDAATFQTESSSISNNMLSNPSRSSPFSSQELFAGRLKYFGIYQNSVYLLLFCFVRSTTLIKYTGYISDIG